MNALKFSYNCCTAGQLPDMSEFDALVIFAVLPNEDEDGETNSELLSEDSSALTDAQRATVFYSLHARTEDGDLEPLHDEKDLSALMQIAQQLSGAVDLPVYVVLPAVEVEQMLSGITLAAESAELDTFTSLELNAVMETLDDAGDSECEALFGVASGRVALPVTTSVNHLFYTLYGRLPDGRALALHDEDAFDAINRIAAALAAKTSLPLVLN